MLKDELRKKTLEIRKTLNTKELSEKIMQNLFNLKEYKVCRKILCYYPLEYEISDLKCVEDSTKQIFLPRVKGLKLEICPYNKEKIKFGSFNIMEPQTEPVSDINIIDMVITPALATDKNGYRLGYGKGYYDRLLKKISDKCVKIALCYSDFVYDSIEPCSYDEKVDMIVTEKDVYNC